MRDDITSMSDLSNLLGTVYGDNTPDGPPVHREPAADDRAPAWADEARLDEAFQNWTPGPGPDAPAHEHDMMGSRPMVISPADPDHDLAAALSAALAAESPAAPIMAAPAPRVQAPAPMAPVAQMPTMAVAPTYAPPVMAPTMSAPVAAMAVAMWQFGDDDIFPMGRKGAKKSKR